MRRAEISAPAMFGRLPDQRDYVRWRVSANEGQVWQAWLNQQTWLGQGRHIVLPEGTDVAKAGINDGWLHLSPREKTVQPEHHPLPWSFVLSPGFLPIGGRDEWLTGVLTASRDSTGRPWPLVIYQRAGREWLEESLDDTQGWLYWLAAAQVAPQAERRGRLAEQTDQLWAMWRPGPRWAQWLRSLRRVPQRSRELTNLPDTPVVELPGVRHLPWPGWPEKMLAQQEQGWFWQQNSEGRYVDALRLAGENR